MAVVAPPAFLQNLTNHTAETDRSVPNALGVGPLASNSLKSLGGVNYTLGGAMKVTQSASPAMSVDVPSGTCQVPGTEGAKQGVYTVVNDATVTLTVTASHPTLPRIDVVTVTITDQQYSGVTNTAALVVTAGTPASSPAPATPPADSLVIAQVRVNAAVTQILNANITDVRPPLTAIGGIYVCTTSTKPSNGLYDGFHIFCVDTEQLQVWDGSQWWVIGMAAGWSAYTPTWTNSTTNPVIGNGSLSGVFTVIGAEIRFEINMVAGSTTTFGTGGGYTLGLPIAAVSPVGMAVGRASLNDSSVTGNRMGRLAYINGATGVGLSDESAVRVNQTTPFTFASGDQITVSGAYRWV